MSGKGSFASASLPRHLARGAIGFGLVIGGVAMTPITGPVSLLAAPFGVVALRGCPMCWFIGLLETISRGRVQRSCSNGSCAIAVPGRAAPDVAAPPRTAASGGGGDASRAVDDASGAAGDASRPVGDASPEGTMMAHLLRGEYIPFAIASEAVSRDPARSAPGIEAVFSAAVARALGPGGSSTAAELTDQALGALGPDADEVEPELAAALIAHAVDPAAPVPFGVDDATVMRTEVLITHGIAKHLGLGAEALQLLWQPGPLAPGTELAGAR